MNPFPFDYRSRELRAPLSRCVASIWYARGTVPYTREKIAPSGSAVAVFVFGDAILQTPDNGKGVMLRAERGFLIGPHDRPVINEPTGETFAVGIVTTSVGCESVFGVSPRSIRGKSVELETAWSAATMLRRRLLGRKPETMLDRLQGWLVDSTRPVSGMARCERAVAMLEDDPLQPIANIARVLGVSHGHLDREFGRIVGLTPRAVSRMLRLRRVLVHLAGEARVDWAALAVQHGWFDQAHLIRDFKRHTGVTPQQYLRAQKTMFSERESTEAAHRRQEGLHTRLNHVLQCLDRQL